MFEVSFHFIFWYGLNNFTNILSIRSFTFKRISETFVNRNFVIYLVFHIWNTNINQNPEWSSSARPIKITSYPWNCPLDRVCDQGWVRREILIIYVTFTNQFTSTIWKKIFSYIKIHITRFSFIYLFSWFELPVRWSVVRGLIVGGLLNLPSNLSWWYSSIINNYIYCC